MTDSGSRTLSDIPPAPPPPLDHEKRNLGVTASEIAAVMGISSFEDAITVYAKKIGDLKPPPDMAVDVSAKRWGASQEPEILLVYQQINKVQLLRPGTLQHPDRPWQVASPDGLLIRPHREEIIVDTLDGVSRPRAVLAPVVERGVEAKTAGWRMAHKWGDPSESGQEDAIPVEYFMQCQYGSSVVGGVPWDVPTLIGLSDFRIYHLQFDKELEEMMLEAAYNFVHKHLIPRIPPPPGGKPSTVEYIKKTFPRNTAGGMFAETKHLPIVARLYYLDALKDVVTEEFDRAKNELKFIMGEHESLQGKGWKIRWKKNKSSFKTDWEAVAKEYEQTLQIIASAHTMVPVEASSDDPLRVATDTAWEALNDQKVKKHTKEHEGARPFCPVIPGGVFDDRAIADLTSRLIRLRKEIGQ